MGIALSARAGADMAVEMPVSPHIAMLHFQEKKTILTIQCLNLSLEDSRDPWVQGPVGAAAEMEAHPHCQAEGSVFCGVQLAPSSPRPSQTPRMGCCGQTAKWQVVTQWKMHLMASQEEGFKGKAVLVPCCFVTSLFSSWVQYMGDEG